MFQPQPTPYSTFFPYGLHVANAGLPDYSFEPTPLLGQFGGGHIGGNVAAGDGDGGAVRASARAYTTASTNAFHVSASGSGGSGSGGPASMGLGLIQGLGLPLPTTVAAPSSTSTAYRHSGGSASSAHPGLYNTSMSAVVVPRHHQHHPQHPLQVQHQHHQPQHRHRPQHPHPHAPRRSVISYKMDQQQELDPNDIAQQEAAARDYEPRLAGPLVGEKTSSQAITEEYARADPAFVAKTMALPQTYSHYRPIQGDGNCGYRAIAFAYFETLVQCGDVNLVQSELDRMNVLNKYIEDVGGQDASMIELMVSETIDLFNDLISAMSEGSGAMSILVAKFNDPSISQCLVYHLRLLACARLKGHADQYASYLDTDIETYLATTVMPVNREIDHICVVLVHDILLKPVNIVLEIAYLDRSEGSEVNVHRLPDEANGQDPSTLGPVIYLLYRPGHYDILYPDHQVRAPPVPPVPVTPVNLQINRVTSFVPHNQDYENQVPALQDTSFTMDMGVLAMIPGLSSSFGPPSASPSPMTDQYAASPGPSWVSQPGISASLNQPTPPQPRATDHPVRFSKYSFLPNPQEAATGNNTYEPSCMTNTFKNSHFNTAHYNNQNFQPEMYQPDAEEEAQSSGNNRIGGRKRSTENCSGIKKEK
ncbi:peptidase C65 Otubain-domain-containing protein [Xylaria bambusicola]|uniref:peptidase C65 Otubain-domain-containing protein n=1 Tax=Xylaria bambusicola TaxID=326684 RepID=UPI002007CDAC|nr:peptidase C65 Otubain-domain-containing protein [Xylaria bambusicola]KAI0521055.1 peptidase C65 Otubain-domain-containing protein [Xylaria bambusicola]